MWHSSDILTVLAFELDYKWQNEICCLFQIAIGGMTCSTCSTAVESGLKAHTGTVKVAVALVNNTAEVRLSLHAYSPGSCRRALGSLQFVLAHGEHLLVPGGR